MKFKKTLFFVFLFLMQQVFSRSINKVYMSNAPYIQVELVNAFYELREGVELIAGLARIYEPFFYFESAQEPTQRDIHFNLPDEPERQIFEEEQAMQVINPIISMPWWDSSMEQSINSPLLESSFMGQFNIDWGLNINYFTVNNVRSLPISTDIIDIQSDRASLDYSINKERGRVQAGSDRWISGVIPAPILYLHHCFKDKLWDDWEQTHFGGPCHISTSKLRFDGTYSFDGQIILLVDPDNIVESKSLGVFYGENGLAELEDCIVSNIYLDLESFYYQYLITLGNEFIVPINTNCQLESFMKISMLSGFIFEKGNALAAEKDSGVEQMSRMSMSKLVSKGSRVNLFEYHPALIVINFYVTSEFISNFMEVSILSNRFKVY
ncbi:hypothetical protein [Formosa haliotis]|uniref:hypothetical protein n=1 Tax=Formosa haliotis TaxID=1555194 RepID=UPI000826A699|nr:hypothetical protein [Formosa haliotis]